MKIGARIDELTGLREDIRSLNKTLSEMKDVFNTKELELMQLMEETGLDQAKSARTTVSLKKETVGTVEDWDALNKYIIENDALYLLHRRISVAAYRELLEMGTEIPGVKPTELSKLSMLNT